MTEAKYKVGDWVRVKDEPVNQKESVGERFVVTKVNAAGAYPYTAGHTDLGKFWYDGDKVGRGIWENNLESAWADTTLTPDPVVEEALDAIVEPAEDITLLYHGLIVRPLEKNADTADKVVALLTDEYEAAYEAGLKELAAYKLGALHQARRGAKADHSFLDQVNENWEQLFGDTGEAE